MNIFYAPPEQISDSHLELRGREANHAHKTLRYNEGDSIITVDGHGGWYEGTISRITDNSVWVQIASKEEKTTIHPHVCTAIGLIKKKDRLEFAVEKAVELGAAEILIFRGEQSVKQKVRIDRLETIALAAMKQSLQAWLPRIRYFNSIRELLKHYTKHLILTAHPTGSSLSDFNLSSKTDFLLVTGPEGDFSNDEIDLLNERESKFITLGGNRYRTETASIILLNNFIQYFT